MTDTNDKQINPNVAANTSSPKPANANLRPKHIDGFIKRSPQKINSKKVHTSPQRTKTLMRSVVSKPKPIVTTDIKTKPKPLISHSSADSHLAERAHIVQKSKLVSRFGVPKFNDFKIKTRHAHIPVKEPPADIQKPKTNKSARTDPLLESIEKSNSHTTKPPKKPNLHKRTAHRLHITPKTLNIGLSIMAAVLLFGFFAYQNVPNIAVRVASARAGITATLPGDLPAGFSLNGHIVYRPGQITVSYKSNTDDRLFHVVQTTSAWDSQTLLENFVATNQRSYQTYQDNGKTIYIYDGSNATWVDRGIWYQIEGSSSLNSDQLLHLANSM